MQAKLTVIGGKANKKELSLNIPVIVGRSRGVGLTIAHPMVSRQHCQIFEADGALRIRDLGSTNGTFVGGKKVPEAVLRPHDQFSIGPLIFEIDYQYVGDSTVVEEHHHHEEFTSGDARATSLAPEGDAVGEESPIDRGGAGVFGGEPAEEAAPGVFGMVSDPSAEPVAEAAPAVEASPPEPIEFVEQPAEVAAEATDYYSPEDRQAFAEEAPIDEASVDEVSADPIRQADVAAWDDQEDVPEFDVEPIAPEETSDRPPSVAPPPGITPTEGEVPDFAAWSASQAAEASPPGPVSAPFSAAGEEPSANPPLGPWEDPVDQRDAEPPAPAAAEPRAKPRKRWWPFGRDKAGDKAQPGPAMSAKTSDLGSFGGTPEAADAASAEAANAATAPPPPPSQNRDPAAPTAGDERQADLDDFLNGLG